MFQARGARGPARATAPALIETGAHDMGQGAWTALAQIAADALGLDIDEARVPRRHLRPAGRGHRGRLRPHGDGGHGDPQRRRRRYREARRSRHQDERSPLYGAGNAGVVARGRPAAPPRRREPQRELRATSWPAPAWRRSRAAARRGADPARSEAYAMHAHGAVFAEVKVDPDLGQIRVTRLVGAFAAGPDHQPAHGAQPVLRRHDLGRVLRAARAGGRSTARRAGP